MTPRLLLLSIAPLVLATTAYAQAPGEWTADSQPSYAQPPPVFVPTPDAPRLSVGLNFGETQLAPKGFADQSTSFDGAGLAFRYRPWSHLELELTLGGGKEVLPDGNDGTLAMSTGTLAARYRFNPQNHWNYWLLAGLGTTTVARKDASDQQIQDAQRPHGVLGVGIEHRWDRFAVQFELRALAVGKTHAEMQLSDQGKMGVDGLSGGNFAFGASYYF